MYKAQCKLYMGHSVKLKVDQRATRRVKTGREIRQGCCLSPVLFNLYSEHLTKKAVKGFGHFKIRGQVIRAVNYAGDLLLPAKEETVLQGMLID